MDKCNCRNVYFMVCVFTHSQQLPISQNDRMLCVGRDLKDHLDPNPPPLTSSVSSFRTVGCMSAGPIGLCKLRFIRWSQTVSSIMRGGASPLQTLSCLRNMRDLNNMGEMILFVDQDKKLFSISLLHFCCQQFSHLIYQRRHFLFSLPFLAYLPIESFVIFISPAVFSSQLCLGFPDTIPTCVGGALVSF